LCILHRLFLGGWLLFHMRFILRDLKETFENELSHFIQEEMVVKHRFYHLSSCIWRPWDDLSTCGYL
jgi:hypothetical protein